MISVTSAAAWALLCCGLTALATSLFWYAALHQAETDAAELADALVDEVAAHRATSQAHAKCCDDLRRHSINGSMRRHPADAPSLRLIK